MRREMLALRGVRSPKTEGRHPKEIRRLKADFQRLQRAAALFYLVGRESSEFSLRIYSLPRDQIGSSCPETISLPSRRAGSQNLY